MYFLISFLMVKENAFLDISQKVFLDISDIICHSSYFRKQDAEEEIQLTSENWLAEFTKKMQKILPNISTNIQIFTHIHICTNTHANILYIQMYRKYSKDLRQKTEQSS